MRTAFVVAGLAAAVAAETYTVTHTEDVTITSCAPTHTNCPYKSTSTPAADFNWGEWDDADGSWGEWETATVTTDGKTTITSMKKTSTAPATATATTEVWGEWDDGDDDDEDDGDDDDENWGEWKTATVTKSGSTIVTSVKVTTKPATATSTSTDEWGIWDSATTTATTTATSAKVTTKASSAACPSYTAAGPPEWFSLLPSSVLSSVAAKWTGGPPADWCYYTYSTSSMATQTAPYPTTAPVTSAPAKATGTGVAA